MTLRDFLGDYHRLTQEAASETFLKALKEIVRMVEEDPGVAHTLFDLGMLDAAAELEADDFFGTEGMRL